MSYDLTCYRSLVTSIVLMRRYVRPTKLSNKVYNKLVTIHDNARETIRPWDETQLKSEPKLLDSEKCYELIISLKGFGSWKATGVQRELQKLVALLEDRCEKLMDKEYEQAFMQGKSMTNKEAVKLVNEFLNGPHVQSLLIHKGGTVKRSGKNTKIPTTYGCLEATMVSQCYTSGSFEYYNREEAFLTWFGSELGYYYDYLIGKGRSSSKDEDEDGGMGFFSALMGASSSKESPSATETAWAQGAWCSVCLEGETIPGIVLRVDPVKFDNEELDFMAQKIKLTKEKAEEAVVALKGDSITELSFGKGVVVSLTPQHSVMETDEYDPSIVNIEPSAEQLVKRIVDISKKPESEQPKVITGLFYGVPGTGKSKLVEYIGHQLNLPVLKKTYGELQSKYVGEGEKNLHKAFEEARETNSILLIDEIDSMANSRESADRRHQKTFTNQLLTELDNFQGYFFCTSNFMEGLDSAVLRRLFLKTEFKFLTPEQVETCFKLYFPRFKKSKLGIYDFVTPGDLKVVQQAALFEPKVPTIARIREMVTSEIDLKRKTLPEVMKADMGKSFQF
jgi:SpoVK/Ycf46/Vps4 family AAA+-type ATPase